MGCYPLGQMMSKAFRRRNGKRQNAAARTVVMTPPPPTAHYDRAMAKSVTFSDKTNIITMPPEHLQTPPESEKQPEAIISPATYVHSTTEVPAPEIPEPKVPKQVRFSNKPHFHEGAPHGSSQQEPPPIYSEARPYYVASPLPCWEDEQRPRRDYFSREYHYYPTPIREGIYSIATDANRLTSIFSEENPNACSII